MKKLITIGGVAQLGPEGGVPAGVFTTEADNPALYFDAAAPGTEIKFRVRYIGDDPAGMPFYAALIGTAESAAGLSRAILPINTGCAVVR